jgi:hypothetical protein
MHINKPGFKSAYSKYSRCSFTDHQHSPGCYVRVGQSTSTVTLDNAETFTFFAFLMRCADKNYRLDMLDGNGNFDYAVANRGYISYDRAMERADGWAELGPTPN